MYIAITFPSFVVECHISWNPYSINCRPSAWGIVSIITVLIKKATATGCCFVCFAVFEKGNTGNLLLCNSCFGGNMSLPSLLVVSSRARKVMVEIITMMINIMLMIKQILR